jgi:alanine-synthesizing transaminase
MLDAVAASPHLAVPTPAGALYGFPGIDPQALPGFDDYAFALDLLEHEHVLLVPGSSFNVPYRNRFRVTLLPDAAMLREAFVRIGRALDRAADRAGVSRHVAVA